MAGNVLKVIHVPENVERMRPAVNKNQRVIVGELDEGSGFRGLVFPRFWRKVVE